jgi:pyruvate dehydrogenase E2 component (dihydrolipoamide acetyltransferase)
MAYRAKVKAQGEALGLPNITINDIVAYATVQVLKVSPQINAHFLGDKSVQYPYVNLGIATDTERGLMVPVVHGADRLSLSQLSTAVKPLLADCQTGSINPDLLGGGTFTITNMGMLGVESFTPVLNIPEVAILGVGGLSLKPVMKNGEVTHVQSINLSLTVDHQVVDGAPAARFLKTLCASLENFELTLAQ